jgi:hypothetical protein
LNWQHQVSRPASRKFLVSFSWSKTT